MREAPHAMRAGPCTAVGRRRSPAPSPPRLGGLAQPCATPHTPHPPAPAAPGPAAQQGQPRQACEQPAGRGEGGDCKPRTLAREATNTCWLCSTWAASALQPQQEQTVPTNPEAWAMQMLGLTASAWLVAWQPAGPHQGLEDLLQDQLRQVADLHTPIGHSSTLQAEGHASPPAPGPLPHVLTAQHKAA